ncbi:hypothetical protein DPX16_23607 [Anabarilius grahami]|uniref:Uncharacterized protein n=1 Tax=Anabarilius grahami TaxID=495550 RepID=A0A3N0ZAY4_ANAGA|nr:hypothetical protein DPX16_23607 [Anabarilius grahami]
MPAGDAADSVRCKALNQLLAECWSISSIADASGRVSSIRCKGFFNAENASLRCLVIETVTCRVVKNRVAQGYSGYQKPRIIQPRKQGTGRQSRIREPGRDNRDNDTGTACNELTKTT